MHTRTKDDEETFSEGPAQTRQFWKSRSTILIVVVAVMAVIAAGYVTVQFFRSGPADSKRTSAAGEPAADASGAPTDSAGPSAAGGIGAASASPRASGAAGRTAAPVGPPRTTGFPGPDNTGVPRGTVLTNFTGSCRVTTAGMVIDSKTVNCSLEIHAANVVVRKSKVLGQVGTVDGGSVRIEDSEVDDGQAFEAAVGAANISIYRSNIHGGETSVNCGHNCHIEDSWLHGQYMPPGGNWHLDAYLTNGGDHVTLIHNTIACDNPERGSGGCSGDAAIFGDDRPNSYFTFDRNLFVATVGGSYCLYGGTQDNKTYGRQTDHIVATNNVFQRGKNGKCGTDGAVTYFDTGKPGSLWSNNVWDDGKPLNL
jgi:hypothetical protein